MAAMRRLKALWVLALSKLVAAQGMIAYGPPPYHGDTTTTLPSPTTTLPPAPPMPTETIILWLVAAAAAAAAGIFAIIGFAVTVRWLIRKLR